MTEGILIAPFAIAVWVPMVILLAGALRRLLGVPVSSIRAGLIAIALLLTINVAATQVLRTAGITSPEDVDEAVPLTLLLSGLTLLWVFVIGLVILVILEALVPTGSLPSPLRLAREWPGRQRRAKRYAQIVRLAVQHGLGGYFRSRSGSAEPGERRRIARALRQCLESAGVTFVKFGQMLSARSDLLPVEFITELSRLQTGAAPMDWATARTALQAALGRDPDTVFAWIDPEPLASASVAQVYLARLVSGAEVIVKVQRPQAKAQVVADVDILIRLAIRLERSTLWARQIGAVQLARGFAQSLEEELDYLIEADNLRSMQAQLQPEAPVQVPHVYDDLCTDTVLVMSRLPGRTVGDATELLGRFAPEVRLDLAQTLLDEVLRQIITTGVFHADLHPGNILIADNGRLGLLDFGAVGRLDAKTREALGLLLLGLDSDDPVQTTDALLDLAGRPADVSLRHLDRDVGELVTRYRAGFGRRGSRGFFDAVLALVVRHGIAVPPQVAGMFRALATLEGTLALISPDVDMMATARNRGRESVEQHLQGQDLLQSLQSQARRFLPVLQRLPRRLDSITEDLAEGRFTIRVRAFQHPEDRRFLTGLVEQIVTVVLVASAAISAVMLLTRPPNPIDGVAGPYLVVGSLLLLIAVVLALRLTVLLFWRPGHRQLDP